MTRWGEIKCPRCEEHAALVEKAKKVQSSYWKEDGTLFTDQTVVPGLLKRLEELGAALEESDAREARLEARIKELEAKLDRVMAAEREGEE